MTSYLLEEISLKTKTVKKYIFSDENVVLLMIRRDEIYESDIPVDDHADIWMILGIMITDRLECES